MGQNTVLFGESLFAILVTKMGHITLPLFPQTVTITSHTVRSLYSLSTLKGFRSVSGKEMCRFILVTSKAPQKDGRFLIPRGTAAQVISENQSPTSHWKIDCSTAMVASSHKNQFYSKSVNQQQLASMTTLSQANPIASAGQSLRGRFTSINFTWQPMRSHSSSGTHTSTENASLLMPLKVLQSVTSTLYKPYGSQSSPQLW
jgi:hypothetical protein